MTNNSIISKIEPAIFEYIRSGEIHKNPYLTQIQKDVSYLFFQEANITKTAKKVRKSREQVKNIVIKSALTISRYLTPKSGDMLIEESLLNNRAKNCLISNNMKYLKDINGYDEKILKKMRNLGKKSIEEIKEYIKDLGFSLT